MPGAKSSSRKGWKTVNLDDDFLFNLEEPGFLSLETLDAADVAEAAPELSAALRTSARAETGEPAPTRLPAKATKKKQKQKKKRPRDERDTPAEPMQNDGAAADVDRRVRHASAATRREGGGERPAAAATAAGRSDAAQATGAVSAGAEDAECGGEEGAAEVAADDQLGEGEGAANEEEEADNVLGPVDDEAWQHYGLLPQVRRSLVNNGFVSPMPIQHECLPAAVLGNADLIGAAQTGSGKTLAFALPIINLLAGEAGAPAGEGEPPASEGEPEGDAAAPASAAPSAPSKRPRGGRDVGARPLGALVLCPTRELANQVHAHLAAVATTVGVTSAVITGGMSRQKQERVLRGAPAVVVATPGRLWDLMTSGAPHVGDLSGLACLVIDEADRMVASGHFQELSAILARIPAFAERHAAAAAATGRVGGGGESAAAQDDIPDLGGGEAMPSAAPLPRSSRTLRTYVFSATLTLPDAMKARLQRSRTASRGSDGSATFEALVDMIPFRGKPKIADLTSERKLAANIREAYILCSEKQREAYVAYVLTMHRGRTLVFLNAISGVRRLAAILKLLGFPVQVLHAQQQQRQRLKALDRFKVGDDAVLVATDVAARGLDIAHVSCVIQCQLPPSADTYIHRAGRTARGADGHGANIAIVVPSEAGRYKALGQVLVQLQPARVPIHPGVLEHVQRQVHLALRIDAIERQHRKDRADGDWFRKSAGALDLPLDIPGEAADEAADSARHQPQDARQLRGALEALGPAPSSDMLAALFDQAPKRKAESDVFDSLAASVLKHPDGTERRPAAPVARAKRPKVTSLAECRHQALVAAVQKRQAKRDRKRK